MKKFPGFPEPQGLYDPRFEKDGCGIGLLADLHGSPTHAIVHDAVKILERLNHRGATGCDPCTGDGAGILTQIPDEFLRREMRARKVALPTRGEYAVGMAFLPRAADARAAAEARIARLAAAERLEFLGWRDVPVRSEAIGELARTSEPPMRQFFVGLGAHAREEFERKLYLLRKSIERDAGGVYVASLSSKTLVYKGLLLPEQLSPYFPDLMDSDFKSALALVHSRFSTNTFPAWHLAHPYRYLCHNGEINTLRGNLNWMQARQGNLSSPYFTDEEIPKLLPIISPHQSDSACLDNAFEFLIQGGRSLPHAMMMLIPEPWAGNPAMDLERRGFYEYHSAMMEPWDGPAAVAFTDGELIGATLDRNGLRPCRYLRTRDGRVALSSEAGVLDADPADVLEKGRLQPGKMFLVDPAQGRIVSDEEIKRQMASRRPYRQWVQTHRVSLEELPQPVDLQQPDPAELVRLQRAFGFTREEIERVLGPMFTAGEEPTSSMGADIPLAVLSTRPQLLFRYFRQLFAQVTNPPIDPIREALVMSLVTNLGPKSNLWGETPESCRRIRIQQPVLTNAELEKIRQLEDPEFKSLTLPMLWDPARGPAGLSEALERLCRDAEEHARAGTKFLILSDRAMSAQAAPIPSLLATSAVHQHLIRTFLRTEAGIIVESGEPRDVHHMACLLGYGAGGINPYVAFETAVDLARNGMLPEEIDADTAQSKYVKAISKGLLKIFSKMGISTAQSYCGAQIFEALGLGTELIERHFTGTPSRIGGLGLAEIAEETLTRHRHAYASPRVALETGGEIHYRVGGDLHQWNPETISKLQVAARTNDAKTFAEFSALVDAEGAGPLTLRGLLSLRAGRAPVELADVEPAAQIVRRFTTGAMSLGAISPEAHETLAIAMNRLGAKSNTGEGGEDTRRFTKLPNGDSKNSAIKQVASARFGVTAEYLVNAQELQIKMAQGAKPGEGGQLPGHKVDATIAGLRHSTPGVTLISPPPHHDIYSIEDLAQLIFDLKRINPVAAVSVKLVAEVGVGTVAAGVAKAKADKILISGDSGGTGASPLSSIHYAGIPWEMGLAETHQTLLLNGLRSRVRLETDGQLKTGRDVVIAALLGADEFGFATAPLIVEGCILMRKCHLNTCPVGIATQDPLLRKKFTGQPEHVVNYLFFVAEETRAWLAKLGYRSVAEAIGRGTESIAVRQDILDAHPKTKNLDLSVLLHSPEAHSAPPTVTAPEPVAAISLDEKLLPHLSETLERGTPVTLASFVANVDRTIGTRISYEVTRRYGGAGLPEDTITLELAGSCGQSLGAFLAPGITLSVEGEANDYVGKGLSGGKIFVRPPRTAAYPGEKSILVGNTALYGATRGETYIAGLAGERFAVRNSGATAVVEGVGDHGCEYMTGGLVVVIGPTGRNFAAGMSGGEAYVFDPEKTLRSRCNLSLVELERLTETADARRLWEVLERHYTFTDSARARMLLDRWKLALEQFTKVIPTEYKRALKQARDRKLAEAPLHV